MANKNEWNEAPVISAIYEKMLKVIHQNPTRLKEVSDLIRRLDDSIISEEFLAMYTQFENAARRLIK